MAARHQYAHHYSPTTSANGHHSLDVESPGLRPAHAHHRRPLADDPTNTPPAGPTAQQQPSADHVATHAHAFYNHTSVPPVRVSRTSNPQVFGMAVLLVVAVLWGSYAPSLKYLFLLPNPPSAALITAAQSTLAALFLMVGAIGAVMESATPGTVAALIRSATPAGGRRAPVIYAPASAAEKSSAISAAGTGAAAGNPLLPVGSGAAAGATAAAAPAAGAVGGGSGPGGASAPLLALPSNSLTVAGVELGIYSFCAVALGTWGVQRLSATKVAFLSQATSLITPVLVALAGQAVRPLVWLACCGGVAGGALVAMDGLNLGGAVGLGLFPPPPLAAALGDAFATRLDHGDASARELRNLALSDADLASAPLGAGAMTVGLAPAVSQSTMGLSYVLASCVFYALGTVRLGVHSVRFTPLELASASSLAYAALALVWLLLEILGQPNNGRADYSEIAAIMSNHAALAMLLWAGLGPGALSSYLQALGQRTVPAAQAQVIYSSTPLWSAVIARMVLSGEHMGLLACLGGGIMLSSSLLVSLADMLPSHSSGSGRPKSIG